MAQRIVNGEQYEAVLIGGDVGQGSSLTVDGKAYKPVVTFSRPGDTTGYTAGDVVGSASSAVHQLTNAGPVGGAVLVQSVDMYVGTNAVPAGMGAFRVHFFNAAPSGVADNTVFNLTTAERSGYCGFVDLPAPQDFGDTLWTQADYGGRMIKLASGQTTLWAEIETRGAYTPASGTTYELQVGLLEVSL
jgi:hypothetical protein